MQDEIKNVSAHTLSSCLDVFPSPRATPHAPPPPPCSHAPYLRASSFPQVHISNLPDSLGEEELHMVFQRYGSILRVKKIKDYAFVNFAVRGRHGGLLVSLMFLHWF